MSPASFNQPSDSGQTMTEYSVVVGVLILGVVAAVGFFGGAVAQCILNFAGAIG
jgi:Flp pilus assembly pilin Flp